MNKKSYEFNLEGFSNFLKENNLESTFEKIPNSNAVIVKVANFKEMKMLFFGKACWAICCEEGYWKSYVSRPNRVQYVYLDFDKSESLDGSAFAFTYDPKEKTFTDAANRANYNTCSHEQINYILRYIFGASAFANKLGAKNKG